MTTNRVGTPPAAGGASWDFFVSYTRDDQQWAEWIAWELEQAGYKVLIQAWDMTPGSNWVFSMNDGVQRSERMIAVLSSEYTRSLYGTVEWQGAFKDDPLGAQRKLLVARVEKCDRPGPLGQVVSFDLFGLPEDAAREALVRAAQLAVSGGRAKPASRPMFPTAGAP